MPARPNSLYSRFARGTSRLAGRPFTFALMLFLVVAWAVSGPIFDYSEAWQLTINTATTIITFLMVFLIQATQNRDSEALQLKLDEIIRTQRGAHNTFVGIEELDEDELLKIREEYLKLAERARLARQHGVDDTGVPRMDIAAKR
jgi:low affinity Fe/Cu permease